MAVVVVLLALLWAVVSRRKSSAADFQESILISTLDDADSEQLPGEKSELATQQSEETSFLSDFSPSDIDALQDETGEVDPLAEADVYIAYGRYQQAEDLIRQAIERSPERAELKLKLFEILFATKDEAGFVELAESASLDGLDQKERVSWGKIVAMGSQLAGGHRLFAAVEESSSEDEVVSGLDSAKDEDSLDDGADPGEPSTDFVNEVLDLEGLDDLGDLDQLSLDDDSAEADEIDDDSLDLDFGELDRIGDYEAADDLKLDFGAPIDSELEEIGTGSAGRETVDGDSLNLDIDLSRLEMAEDEVSDDISFDLSDIDGEMDVADVADENVLEIEDPLEQLMLLIWI